MNEGLGLEFFNELGKRSYRGLADRKIIPAKGVLLDVAAFPEETKYPYDVGL